MCDDNSGYNGCFKVDYPDQYVYAQHEYIVSMYS